MDDKQLTDIIARLESIERRLSRLEQPKTAQPPLVTPPPFSPATQQAHHKAERIRANLLNPPAPQDKHKPPEPRRPQVAPIPPNDSPKTKREPRGIEYSVGAKVLPLAGAGLTILTIIYFTTEAFRNGWITSEMIFGAAVTLCVSFIGIGQLLRDEKEQFGQILTGVGSCGLYITFAAGHFAQQLYPSITMLGLFMGLSLVNLSYGFWKGSTAFLRIGVSGGFTAAVLPLVQESPQIETHLLLHALIVIPSTLIIARRKWILDAMLFLPSAVAVTVPALWMPGAEWAKVVALSLTAILSTYAFACAYQPSKRAAEYGFDPRAATLPIALAAIAWINFEIRDSYPGSLHIIAFGLAIYGLSLIKLDPKITQILRFSALTIPLILAPWGAAKVETAFLLSGLAIGLAWIGNRQQNRLLQGLAGVAAVLAVAAYIVATLQYKIPSWQLESYILAALIAAGLYGTITVYKSFATKEPNLAIGAGTLSLLTLRLLTLTLTKSPAELTAPAAFIISTVVIASVLHALGRLFKSSNLTLFATISSSASLAGFVHFATANPRFGENILLSLLMLGSAYYLFRLYWVDSCQFKQTAATGIIVPAAAVLAHSVHVALSHPLIHASSSTGIVWGLLLAAFALRLIAKKLAVPDLRIAAFIGLAITLAAYAGSRLDDPTRILWAESVLIFAMIGTLFLFAEFEWTADLENQNFVAGLTALPMAAGLAWFLQIIQIQGLNREVGPALTVSGVLTTILVCAVIYRRPWPSLLATAWLAWFAAAFPVQIFFQETPTTFAFLLLGQLTLALAPEKLRPSPGIHRYIHLSLTTILVSRIGTDLIPITIANPDATPALTVTWTALSVTFLVLGFCLRITEIRHAGLLLIFLAGGKLILLDLAETAELIRVALTFGLGLAMIGGGYLYIKLQNRLDPDSPKIDPIAPGQPSQEPGN